jgi:mRNA interferase MazF
MKRGDFVTIAVQGDPGNPRVALVMQADQFAEHVSVTLLPLTATLVDAPLLRITVEPDLDNGLDQPFQVMVDKAITVKRDKIGPVLGRIDADLLVKVERTLAMFLGIVK